MEAPPSRTEWLLAGELSGHCPSQTLAWLAWCSDYEDEQEERARAAPEFVISPPRGRRRWWFR
jgi:hypothetical protein